MFLNSSIKHYSISFEFYQLNQNLTSCSHSLSQSVSHSHLISFEMHIILDLVRKQNFTNTDKHNKKSLISFYWTGCLLFNVFNGKFKQMMNKHKETKRTGLLLQCCRRECWITFFLFVVTPPCLRYKDKFRLIISVYVFLFIIFYFVEVSRTSRNATPQVFTYIYLNSCKENCWQKKVKIRKETRIESGTRLLDCCCARFLLSQLQCFLMTKWKCFFFYYPKLE